MAYDEITMSDGISRETAVKYEKDLAKYKDWLSYFLLVFTVATIVFQTAEFLNIFKTPTGLASAYLMLLYAYIAHKEINRWAGVRMKFRSGELFVYIWWALFIAMMIIAFYHPNYHLPEDIKLISYDVLAAFLLGELSKAMNKRIEGPKNQDR